MDDIQALNDAIEFHKLQMLFLSVVWASAAGGDSYSQQGGEVTDM